MWELRKLVSMVDAGTQFHLFKDRHNRLSGRSFQHRDHELLDDYYYTDTEEENRIKAN